RQRNPLRAFSGSAPRDTPAPALCLASPAVGRHCPDARSFTILPMKLRDLAAQLGAVLHGDGEVDITGVSGIEEAAAGQITFVSNPRYAAAAKTTQASAVLVA